MLTVNRRSPIPKVVDHDQRRSDIVDVTWQLIVDGGLEAATMRKITSSAGFTNGAKHYFPSQDDIIEATWQRALAKMSEYVTIGDLRGIAALREILSMADITAAASNHDLEPGATRPLVNHSDHGVSVTSTPALTGGSCAAATRARDSGRQQARREPDIDRTDQYAAGKHGRGAEKFAQLPPRTGFYLLLFCHTATLEPQPHLRSMRRGTPTEISRHPKLLTVIVCAPRPHERKHWSSVPKGSAGGCGRQPTGLAR